MQTKCYIYVRICMIVLPALWHFQVFNLVSIPGGFSHWHGIRICACLLGHFFAKFGIAIGGFHQRRRSPNYINWVYFGQIIVKSTQFDPNWVLFFRKWYTDGWEIWQKIGIEIVRFSRSGRHITYDFGERTPPGVSITPRFLQICAGDTCTYLTLTLNGKPQNPEFEYMPPPKKKKKQTKLKKKEKEKNMKVLYFCSKSLLPRLISGDWKQQSKSGVQNCRIRWQSTST